MPVLTRWCNNACTKSQCVASDEGWRNIQLRRQASGGCQQEEVVPVLTRWCNNACLPNLYECVAQGEGWEKNQLGVRLWRMPARGSSRCWMEGRDKGLLLLCIEGGRQHHLLVEYDRKSSLALGQVLKNNYEAACTRDVRLRTLFKKPPKPTFQKGTNLKQMLVKAKLPKPRPVNTRVGEKENRRGVTRCSRGTGKCQCGASHHLTSSPREVVKEVITHTSGKTIKIEDEINCKTRSCLYVLESTKDPRKRQYADLTRGRDPHQAARLRYQLGPGQAGPQPLQVDNLIEDVINTVLWAAVGINL